MLTSRLRAALAAVALVLSCPASAALSVDIGIASNGCPAAIASDGIDDHAAIQCQIDVMAATPANGGRLLFRPGAYEVSQTLVVPGGHRLIGAGQSATAIVTLGGADITALRFTGPYNSFGGIEDMRIACSQSTVAQAACVHVTHNVPVVFRDFQIWGGLHGLHSQGVDGYFDGGFIGGSARAGSAVFSQGANWYIRTKFNDYAGYHQTYAFVQNSWSSPVNNGVQENHFIACDFSGNYDYSVFIYDGNSNQAVTDFSGSVFAAPIVIYSARATLFRGAEFGSPVLINYAPLSISGSYAFSPLAVTGSGPRSCGANIGVTC
jgi:hypothetical protein